MLTYEFSRYGSVEISGFSDGKTAFMQGDDAVNLHNDLEKCSTEQQEQDVLSEYSVVAN